MFFNVPALEKTDCFYHTDLKNSPVTCKNVREETHEEPVLSHVVKYLHCGWPHEVETFFDPFVHRKIEMSIDEGGCLEWGGRVVIPPNLREKTLKDLHEVYTDVSQWKTSKLNVVAQAWIEALRNLFLTIKCVKLISQDLRKLPFTIVNEQTT